MLGYFGIYSQLGSSWFRTSTNQPQKRQLFCAIQPHEIARLNAISSARKVAKAAEPRTFEERHAA